MGIDDFWMNNHNEFLNGELIKQVHEQDKSIVNQATENYSAEKTIEFEGLAVGKRTLLVLEVCPFNR
ncbi:MAG: hypothetical protein FI718_05465 [SAR202 cluster bacterium]|nr:hypothetical protein [SAR202 cluster bacterium]